MRIMHTWCCTCAVALKHEMLFIVLEFLVMIQLISSLDVSLDFLLLIYTYSVNLLMIVAQIHYFIRAYKVMTLIPFVLIDQTSSLKNFSSQLYDHTGKPWIKKRHDASLSFSFYQFTKICQYPNIARKDWSENDFSALVQFYLESLVL